MRKEGATEVADPELDALIARCRRSDASAWRELFDAYVKLAWSTARRLGTPEAELEDVCQEVFLVVYRKIGDFEGGQFTSWLYRITANVVASRHRKRRLRQALRGLFFGGQEAEPLERATPELLCHQRETRHHVAAVLERMSPLKREVFALYELEGLSGESIAERVGCKVETVWTRLHYARKEFAELARERGLMPCEDAVPEVRGEAKRKVSA